MLHGGQNGTSEPHGCFRLFRHATIVIITCATMEVLDVAFSAVVYTIWTRFGWLKNVPRDTNHSKQPKYGRRIQYVFLMCLAICARNFKGPTPALMRFVQDLCWWQVKHIKQKRHLLVYNVIVINVSGRTENGWSYDNSCDPAQLRDQFNAVHLTFHAHIPFPLQTFGLSHFSQKENKHPVGSDAQLAAHDL